jgi:protein-S-isoprenylcysteine O-methyltransferase Ste14
MAVVVGTSVAWLVLFLQFPPQGPGSWADVGVNVVLFTLWGGIHSLLARKFSKKILEKIVGPDRVTVFFVFTAGITLFLLVYFWMPLPGFVWQAEGWAYWLLTALFVVFLAAAVWPVSYLDAFRFLGLNSLSRTPEGEAPGLVTDGPYGYIRHPIYTFLILAFSTGPVMTWTRVEFALLAALYMILASRLEERSLREELGPAYEEYCRHVPRFIPRLTKYRPQ